jgi:osmotically-inducible protein OsmY
MRKPRVRKRNRFMNLLPLTAAAVASALAISACDRSSTRMSSEDPGRLAQAGDSARGNGSAAAMDAPFKPSPPPPMPSPPPPKEALTDPAITGRINSAIDSDPAMRGADVSVNTSKGVVALYGVVRNPEQTAIASAHAQRQDGVMRVDNELAVRAN